jgi:hypothetical protein
MPDEYVELDEEGSPTGKSFGDDDEDERSMEDFDEVSESDVPLKDRVKARAKEAKKRVKSGASTAKDVGEEALDDLAESAGESARSGLKEAINEKKTSRSGRGRRRRKNDELQEMLGGDRNLGNDDFRGVGLKEDVETFGEPGDGDFAGRASEVDPDYGRDYDREDFRGRRRTPGEVDVINRESDGVFRPMEYEESDML